MSNPDHSERWNPYRLIASVLIFGYLCNSRSFAHLGAAPIYIGELGLFAFVATAPNQLFRLGVGSLLRRTAFTGLAWCVGLFIVYGLLELLRGIGAGFDKGVALQNIVFNVYTLFLLPGILIGLHFPDFLERLIGPLAWIHGIIGFLFVTLFTRLGWVDTFADSQEVVRLFSTPYGSAISMIGLICFRKDLRRYAIPFLLNAFVMLGVQLRAEWLGFAVVIPIASVLSGQTRQFLRVCLLLGLLLLVGLITNFHIASPGRRGGEISSRALVGRAVAAVSPELAAQINPQSAEFSKTISWRKEWWKSLIAHTNKTFSGAMLGPGYGFPIWEYNPLENFGKIKNRTPHNVLVYALSYTGWIGVALFVAVQLALFRCLWASFRTSGQAFGLCLWGYGLVYAMFSNYMEAPFGAIPFYLMLGISLAPGSGSRANSVPPIVGTTTLLEDTPQHETDCTEL